MTNIEQARNLAVGITVILDDDSVDLKTAKLLAEKLYLQLTALVNAPQEAEPADEQARRTREWLDHYAELGARKQ